MPLLTTGAGRGTSGAGGGGAPTTPLDGLSGLTGGWSQSRKLLSAYGGAFSTDIAGETNVWLDQSGAGRNFTASTSGTRPDPATAGPNSRACLNFNGTTDVMDATSGFNFISATDGYFIASFITNRTSTNNANIYDNDPVFNDAGGNLGIHIKAGTIGGYNFDTNVDVTATDAISTATTYVVEWWHTGGNLNFRLNGGTTRTIASGNSTISAAVRIGRVRAAGTVYFSGSLFEMAAFSTVPSGTVRDALVADFRAWIG